MRALAVLGIILYHAGISPYSGGFVTLDVFFVLSGYLITYLLLREIGRDGTISLRSFYTRRARRILPAATVATIGTVVASWLWLPLIEAHEVAYDAIWAGFFAANVRFAIPAKT
jgi:peptidoglycan/LPS O-acetylase OafA/YrhL